MAWSGKAEHHGKEHNTACHSAVYYHTTVSHALITGDPDAIFIAIEAPKNGVIKYTTREAWGEVLFLTQLKIWLKSSQNMLKFLT